MDPRPVVAITIFCISFNIQAQDCAPQEFGQVHFQADTAKELQENSGVFAAQSGEFCYTHGFGGPTGESNDTTDAWLKWYQGSDEDSKKEREYVKKLASSCGIQINSAQDVKTWFSQKGVDCIIKNTVEKCKLEYSDKGARIEIDNTHWWKVVNGGRHVDAYKAIIKSLRTNGPDGSGRFTVVPKNLGEELGQLKSAVQAGEQCYLASMAIDEKDGTSAQAGCGGITEGFQHYITKKTEKYTVSCSEALAAGAENGGRSPSGR